MGRLGFCWQGLLPCCLVRRQARRTQACKSQIDAVFAESDYNFVVESKSCRATYAVITIEFNAMVVDATVDDDVGQTSFADKTVVFVVPYLEASPTLFTIVLDTCGEVEGIDIVAT